MPDTADLPEPENVEKKIEKARSPYKPSVDTKQEQLAAISLQLKELETRMTRVDKRLFWILIGGYLKILFIVVPIIFGLFYLPPLISQYAAAFSNTGDGTSVIDAFQEMLNLLQ